MPILRYTAYSNFQFIDTWFASFEIMQLNTFLICINIFRSQYSTFS